MSVFQSGSRALITGGASGIGLAVAEICLKAGMSVTIVDFNKETLELAQKNLKGDVQTLQADVSKEDNWRNVKEKVGDVDFLMLNAGVGGQGTWGDADYFHKVRGSSVSGAG
jgi:NAD(P)-dependent dehydrogenase (short-subunit alcohol dehydrogenase family)